jgi:hypothetical protein
MYKGSEVVHMRIRWLPAVALLVLAGCGYRDTSVNPPVSSPTGYALYLAAPGAAKQMAVINAGTGQPLRQLPIGTPSPDWSRLYAVVDHGQTSSLQVLDPRTNKVLRQVQLDGRYELPPATYSGRPGGLSENGRWLVLQRQTGSAVGSSSHYLLFNTSFDQSAAAVDLNGDFAFDAVTNDGQSLYAVEYMSADRTLYRVRLYHVAGQSLDPRIIVDKFSGALAMSGIRLTSVSSNGGGYVFSLYVNGRHGPFIHALDTQNGFALCLNLPKVQSSPAQERMWAETMSPDGRWLYAVNGSLGLVVRVDISSGVPRIMDTSHFIPAFADHRPATAQAMVSPDGQTLFTASDKGVVAFDLRALKQKGVWLPDITIESLALSPDGGWLFAVDASQSRLVEVSAGSGTLAGQVQGVGTGSSIFRVEPA